MNVHFIDRVFLAHPRTAGQSYFEHLWFAWRFGGSMLLGAAAAFLHGVLPLVHTSTASRKVRELNAQLEHRGSMVEPAAREARHR